MAKKKILPSFFIIVFISFCLSLIIIYFAGKKLDPIIIRYSTAEVGRIANVILNDIINLDSSAYDNSFFSITRDNEGNIQLIDFDTQLTNGILNSINKKALERLHALEKGDSSDLVLSNSLKGTRLTYLEDGIVCDMPIGVLLGNSLLVNLSPSIPIRFSFIGTVNSNMITNVKEYGFNNALIEVGIEVTIKLRITMPHSTEDVLITTTVNLATQIVQGNVPLYYNGEFRTNSNNFSTQVE